MKVKKRDGSLVDFDRDRIVRAIIKAMSETVLGIDETIANLATDKVIDNIWMKPVVHTDFISDLIEYALMDTDRKDVAKTFILYRESRTKFRLSLHTPKQFTLLTDDFISKYKHSPSPMSPLGEFVYYRTYSRYLPEEGRREYWWETVRRAVEYNCMLVPTTTKEEAEELFDNIFNLRQFLSGRTMWVGGTPVAEKYPMSNFNCSFQTIDEIDSFVELIYILMIGTGVGLRILKSDVAKIQKVRSNYSMIHKAYEGLPAGKRKEHTDTVFNGTMAEIVVGDSKNGWKDAMSAYLRIVSEPQYSNINTIVFNYDSVRPNGEKLKTFGGTASGHDALKDVFSKIDKVFKRHVTEATFKLTPIDCLDICNIIGEGVVVGGVRRTAEILLFDSDDQECISAKDGLYKEVNGTWTVDNSIIHRSLSNNSIYYKEKPTREKLHWQIEKMRYSGEPAFINQESASKRRANFNGVNPCGEILLDSKGMCNLTTLNVMAFVKTDVFGKQWLDKVALLAGQELSVRAGIRMTCVDLELPKWDAVQKRDRLIGCSLTGWQDMVNAVQLSKSQQELLLQDLRFVAHNTAERYSQILGIQKPLLSTTVKPEGTLSQLPVVSSGVHYSHSAYFIRRIRVNGKDPILKVCEELGYDVKPENGQTEENCRTKVVSFPVKSPDGRTKYNVSAIEQLENYKMFMDNYVDHNCSITVHVRENEWEAVEQWLWDNWDDVVGVSFLSLDDNFYQQAPYEAITEEQYNKMKISTPNFIPSMISKYETEKESELSDDPSCATGACPIR